MNIPKNRKKALVTGGTRGIGLAVAQLFRRQGRGVVVTGRSSSGKAPEGCDYMACDFSDSSALESFAREISKMGFDILVNNAGINKIGPVKDYKQEDFDRIQQINLRAPWRICQAVIPHMCEQSFGRIVNITSILGVVSKPGRSAYSSSKFGLFGLSRALALEVAKDNVLVNCLAPGYIDTDLSHQILGEKGMAEVIQKIPLGRLGKAEEIARAVGFLASEENTYMTGQNMVVDGGVLSGC